MPETPLQTLLKAMGQQQPNFLPQQPQVSAAEEARQRFIQMLGRQQPPPPGPPMARPQPGGLPMPPAPREVGRQQMQGLREQAAAQVLGPSAQIPGFPGPSPRQLATQGPTMGPPPGLLERLGQGMRAAVEPMFEPDPETGVVGGDLAMGPLGAAGKGLRFLSGPKFVPRVYHGTKQVFDKFAEGSTKVESLYGPGHYFTDNPAIASGYAETTKGAAPNVRIQSLNFKRVLDLDAPVDQDLLQKATASVGDFDIPKIRTNKGIHRLLTARFGDKAETNDWLLANGYDGLTHIGGGPEKTRHRVWIALDDSTVGDVIPPMGPPAPPKPPANPAQPSPVQQALGLPSGEQPRFLPPGSPPPPGGGSAGGAAGKLTSRVLKRADIRKGLDFASEAEKIHWDDFLKKWADDTPHLPQEAIPFSKIQEAAEELDPALAKRIMGAPAKDPVRHPAVFQHARQRVNEINATVLELSNKLKADLPDPEKWAIQGQIASLESDSSKMLDWIFRTGSEHGRNLAYHRMMAQQTFDDAYWLNRARRMSGGVVDADTHRRLMEILADGRTAQAAGDKAGMAGSRQRLASELAKVEKSGIWETLSTLRKAGLLTGPKTTMRNLLGNTSMQVLEETARVPALIADAAMSVFGKVKRGEFRGTVFPGRGIAPAVQEGATRGMREAGQILKQGATAEDLLKMDIPRELNTGFAIPDWYAKGVFRWMSAQDRPFRVYAYRRSLEEQARGVAIAERRAGSKLSVDDLTKQFVATPTPEMQMQAVAYSEFSVFANKTRGTEAVRRGMSALTEGQKALVDLFVPFKSTPSNVVARVLEYSGGGLVKGAGLAGKRIVEKSLTPQQQHEIAMAFGRGTIGPALIYMGWKMAESGEMSGMTPETPSGRATAEEAGRLPGAMRVGGKWQQVSSLSPIGNLLTIGATIYEQQAKPEPASLPAAVGTAAVRSVAEQPFLSGMQDVTGVLQSSSNLAETGERMVQRMAGSIVPTAVADAARASDPYRRETRGQGVLANIRERLPGVREGLPMRRGVLGRELPQEPMAAINPGIGSPALEQTDPLRAELQRLQVGIGWPAKNDWETDLEYRAKSALTGRKIEEGLRDVVRSSAYQRGAPDVQRALLQREIFRVRTDVNNSLKRNGRWIINPDQRLARLKQRMRDAGFTGEFR